MRSGCDCFRSESTMESYDSIIERHVIFIAIQYVNQTRFFILQLILVI